MLDFGGLLTQESDEIFLLSLQKKKRYSGRNTWQADES